MNLISCATEPKDIHLNNGCVTSPGAVIGVPACTANVKLPNHTTHQNSTEADDANVVADWDVPTYFLTQFKSVQEAREAEQDIKLLFSLSNVRGFKLPIEFLYTIHDPNSVSIVLEYIDGEPKFMTTNWV